MARVGLLSNPGSHNNLAGADGALGAFARSRGCLTATASDGAGLDRAIDSLLDAGVDLLVVNGGDGTAQRVFTRILNAPGEPPLIGLLAGGRTNASAIDAGTAGNRRRQLAAFLRWADGEPGGEKIVRSLVHVRAGGVSLGYGLFAAGAGLTAAIDRCRRFRASHKGLLSGTAGTALWSARLAIDTLLLRRPLPAGDAVLADATGTLYAGSAALLLMTTLQRLPLGMRPFRAGPAGQGPLKLTLITPDCRRRWSVIPALLAGYDHAALTAGNGYRFWCGSQFTVTTGQALLLDGETLAAGAEPFRIDADRQLMLLRTGAGGL